MSNPKEKADELVKKMYKVHSDSASSITLYFAKQCALIAVDEIIKTLPKFEYLEDRSEMVENRELIYWQQVKQEIETYGGNK